MSPTLMKIEQDALHLQRNRTQRGKRQREDLLHDVVWGAQRLKPSLLMDKIVNTVACCVLPDGEGREMEMNELLERFRQVKDREPTTPSSRSASVSIPTAISHVTAAAAFLRENGVKK